MFVLQKIYSFLVDTIQTLLIAASIFLVIYVFLFRPFQVNGASMYPNFMDKQYVLTNIIALNLGNPKRGDVVVFKAPNDPDKDYIKRVIGISGDTVAIHDGDIFLNNQRLDESAYLSNDVKSYGGSFLRDEQSVTVPEGEFFVLGDNRPHSSDSREWGFVRKSAIIGESFFIYWPLDQMKVVKNPYQM